MLTVLSIAPLTLVLAACGEEPTPAPTPTAAAAPVVTEPTLAAPDEPTFSKVFADACPEAKKVSTSTCRSAGMGKADFTCKFGLGDDHYLRYDATLTPGDGEWTLVDPKTTCAQGAG